MGERARNLPPSCGRPWWKEPWKLSPAYHRRPPSKGEARHHSTTLPPRGRPLPSKVRGLVQSRTLSQMDPVGSQGVPVDPVPVPAWMSLYPASVPSLPPPITRFRPSKASPFAADVVFSLSRCLRQRLRRSGKDEHRCTGWAHLTPLWPLAREPLARGKRGLSSQRPSLPRKHWRPDRSTNGILSTASSRNQQPRHRPGRRQPGRRPWPRGAHLQRRGKAAATFPARRLRQEAQLSLRTRRSPASHTRKPRQLCVSKLRRQGPRRRPPLNRTPRAPRPAPRNPRLCRRMPALTLASLTIRSTKTAMINRMPRYCAADSRLQGQAAGSTSPRWA